MTDRELVPFEADDESSYSGDTGTSVVIRDGSSYSRPTSRRDDIRAALDKHRPDDEAPRYGHRGRIIDAHSPSSASRE